MRQRLPWNEYLDAMDAFMKKHQLPEVSMAFFIRYRQMLHRAGITDASKLRYALAASREFEYSGWPPVRLLQLLLEDPAAAAEKYGWPHPRVPA